MFIGCMGLCDHTNGVGYLIILVGLVCLFQFGWASAQISHLAMIPELTPIEAERDELNIIRYFLNFYILNKRRIMVRIHSVKSGRKMSFKEYFPFFVNISL